MNVTYLSSVNDLRPRQWDAILARTHDMLAAAEAGDWDRAMGLERERQAELAEFFSVAPARHEAEWLRQGIHELLASDARLMDLCQAGKAEMSDKIVQLRRTSAAQRTYQETAAA